MAGLLMFAGAHASNMADRSVLQGFLSKYMGSDASKTSLGVHNKFMTHRFSNVKQEGAPNTLSHHNGPTEYGLAKDDSQQVDLNGQYGVMSGSTVFNKPLGMSAIGVSLFALAAILGVRIRRGLQQASTFASGGGHESDMAIVLAQAVVDNTLELKVQESTDRGQEEILQSSGRPLRRDSFRSRGWLQYSFKDSHSLTLSYATQSGFATQPQKKSKQKKNNKTKNAFGDVVRESKLVRDSQKNAEKLVQNLEQQLDADASDRDRDEKAQQVVDLCNEENRDFDAIDAAIANLAGLPAYPDIAVRASGDWRLTWAKSDEGVGFMGTGLHRVPLANLEDVFLSLERDGTCAVTEVIRVLGPFPNVKNLLSGRSSIKPSSLRLKYTKVIDGTGAELTSTQARTVNLRLVALSRRLLVVAASSVDGDDWLVFEREDDIEDALDKLRVPPNTPDEEDEEEESDGFKLPWQK